MTLPYGEGAAITAAVFWAVSSTLFSLACRSGTPQMVNRVRLIGATFLLGLSHLVVLGTLLPDAPLAVWLILGLSGIIGLALGDGLLLWAFISIGPRLSMLLMSLVPIVTTAAGWVLLGEHLSTLKLLAIVVTVGGVFWVVLERNGDRSPFRVTWLGILIGLGAMMGQAVGLLLSRWGLDRMDGEGVALSASYIRSIWGLAAVWIISIGGGRIIHTFKTMGNPRFTTFTMSAMIFGPFLGIWASLIAIQYAPIGVASTLMALSPIFIIPLSIKIFNERISPRAVIGTLLAVAGVAGIFFF